MITLQVNMLVTPNGKVKLNFPATVKPGTYEAVVVLNPNHLEQPDFEGLSTYPIGLQSKHVTFSRSELYDDQP